MNLTELSLMVGFLVLLTSRVTSQTHTQPEHNPLQQDKRAWSGESKYMQQSVNKMVDMMETLSSEVTSLRTQLKHIKFQNHRIFKQLRRVENRCDDAGERRSSRDLFERGGVNSKSARGGSLPSNRIRTACPEHFIRSPETNSCYYFSHKRITWRMADEMCRGKGAKLVAIETRREQRWITQQAQAPGSGLRHCDFWIGANDQKEEGKWKWNNGRQMFYSNWNVGEPNNGAGNEHCAHMLWVFNWQWNDARCNYDNSCYICEADPQ